MALETIIDRDMGWFLGKKKKGILEHTQDHVDSRNGLENPSRRDFLVKTGQVLGGVAAATVAPSFLGLEGEAEAKRTYGNFELLPPGIQISKDRILKLLAGPVFDTWDVPRRTYSFGARFCRNIGIANEQVSKETPYIDPAYYMVREKAHDKEIMRSRNYGDNVPDNEELMEINPALSFFSKGIEFYFKGWISRENYQRWRRDHNKELAEKNFVYSMYAASNPYTAAGVKKSVEEGDAFLGANLGDKTRLAQELMKRFDRMGRGNKQSNDPNNSYNRQLVASWSSFMVTRGNEHKEGRLAFDAKEKDIRTLSEILGWKLEYPLAKKLGSWIRGPPDNNV
ncbi:MAG: hypothetical protein KC589_01845 [Nanoarchaeota archaeon]|nr:hypothetical protein [Nanoarchaeota archaeon]